MIIAIDFDGTCVTHEYPHIGKDIGAVPILKKLVENGHKLMLWTMRGTNSNNTLSDAVKWFMVNKIELWAVNENILQLQWTNSKKQYANLYIDDAALGCPLIFDKTKSDRPFVDWAKVEQMLKDLDYIS